MINWTVVVSSVNRVDNTSELRRSTTVVLRRDRQALSRARFRRAGHALGELWNCGARAADPVRWTSEHVRQWLQWAVQNFSFEGVELARFDGCSGADLVRDGRDRLLQRAPLYVGDILWEHLDTLQKGQLCD